jgi:cysteine desulfurase
LIYLDSASTTKILASSKEQLVDSLNSLWFNSSSSHRPGKQVAKKIKQVRSRLKERLQVPCAGEVIFTSSATESNNLVIKGLSLQRHEEVIYSPADHPSVVMPVKFLESCEVVPICLPQRPGGIVEVERLLGLLNEKTRLLVLTHVNNTNGVVNDVIGISQKVKEKAPFVHIHVDMAQSFTKIPISFSSQFIDSASFSSHKFHGPKGVGGLVLSKNVQLEPLFHGGGQEDNLRSSTHAAELIFSMHSAFCQQNDDLLKNSQQVAQLKEALIQRLKEKSSYYTLPFEEKDNSPYILGILVNGISSDIVLRHLEMEGIIISSGSACSSRVSGEKENLTVLGIEAQDHKSFLRVSFSHENTIAEVGEFVLKLNHIMDELSSLRRK